MCPLLQMFFALVGKKRGGTRVEDVYASAPGRRITIRPIVMRYMLVAQTTRAAFACQDHHGDAEKTTSPQRHRDHRELSLCPLCLCGEKNLRGEDYSRSSRRSISRSASMISSFSTFALRNARLRVNGSDLSLKWYVKCFGRPAVFAAGFLRSSSREASPAATRRSASCIACSFPARAICTRIDLFEIPASRHIARMRSGISLSRSVSVTVDRDLPITWEMRSCV